MKGLSPFKSLENTCKKTPSFIKQMNNSKKKSNGGTWVNSLRFFTYQGAFLTHMYKVKELLGHKTITMTMRYAHHHPESLRSSIEVLDNYHNSATL